MQPVQDRQFAEGPTGPLLRADEFRISDRFGRFPRPSAFRTFIPGMIAGVDDISQGGGVLAGWYPDPSGQFTWRWWTGSLWSDFVAPAPVNSFAAITPMQPPLVVLQTSQARLDRFVSTSVWIWVSIGIVGVFASWASVGFYRSEWHWFHAVFHAIRLHQPPPPQPVMPWWSSFLSIVSLGTVALEVIFLIWQHRAANVAKALGYPARHSPGWGVGCWFVPVVNLWMPYQALRDCLPPNHPGVRRLLYAWLLYLVMSSVVGPATIVALIGAPAVGTVLIAVSVILRIAFGVNAYAALSAIAVDHRLAVAKTAPVG